jgi:hypothetical protein
MMTPDWWRAAMESKSLTYEELGQALSIAPASAKRLAIRRKWLKHPGNDGKTRVTVPLEKLEEAAKRALGDNTGDAAGDVPSDNTGDNTGGDTRDARALIAYLETRVTELGGEVKEARATIADLTAKAGRADVLEALLEAEKRRGEELKIDRDRLLSAITERSREGLFTRLCRVFG